MALIAAYGLLGTPRARVIRETIRNWFDALAFFQGAEDKQMLRSAWLEAKRVLLDAKAPFNFIKGLMSNIIYILISAGWQPISVDAWADPHGDLYVLSKTASPDIVASLIINYFFKKNLVKASTGFEGKGMEDGVDTDATLALVRKSKNVDYPLKCTLEAILSASMWPGVRVHNVAPFFPLCVPGVALSQKRRCTATGHVQPISSTRRRLLAPHKTW